MKFDKVVFDIETTINADKIWCIICKHDKTYYVANIKKLNLIIKNG